MVSRDWRWAQWGLRDGYHTKEGEMRRCTMLLSALVVCPHAALQALPGQFGVERVPLGEIATPCGLEIRGELWPAGQYHLELLDAGRRVGISLAQLDRRQVSVGDALVEELRETHAGPKAESGIVTKDGTRFLRIAVYRGNRRFVRLDRCSDAGTTGRLRQSTAGPLDPVIETELEILAEVHALVRRFGGQIWPGWNDIGPLRFSVTFPDRTVVTVARDDSAVLPRFVRVAGKDVDGKSVYVDRSQQTPVRLTPQTSMRGHGDILGVEVSLVDAATPAGTHGGPTLPSGHQAQYTALVHVLLYVHEAFHAFRASLRPAGAPQAETAELPQVSTDFDPTPDYSAYADLEGQLLLEAYREPDAARALASFKASRVARALKRQAMPPGAIAAETLVSREEGTATWAQLRMATLIKNAGYRGRPGRTSPTVAGALARVDEYLTGDMERALDALAGRTLEVRSRDYLYGAFQCALLDRFAPEWRVGLFERTRTLDAAVEDATSVSPDEARAIAERLKASSALAGLIAKHSRVIRERDEAVQLVASRRGVTYAIDVAPAGAELRSALAAGLPFGGRWFYPHGMKELSSASMRLISRDTPMRLVRTILEWIDVDARAGERGYELTYETLVDGRYLNATLTCRGFSLSAKTMTVNREGDTVKIAVGREPN